MRKNELYTRWHNKGFPQKRIICAHFNGPQTINYRPIITLNNWISASNFQVFLLQKAASDSADEKYNCTVRKTLYLQQPIRRWQKGLFSWLKSGAWSVKVTTNINSNGFWRYTYNNRISEISPLLSTPKLLLGTLKNLLSCWMWWTSGNTSLFHVETAFNAWRMSYWHTEQFSRNEDYLWRF